jgi:MFS family permease
VSFPEIFSIWLMIPASLFLLIGGGPSMVTAMIWTMLADVTPAAERAGVYYMIMAVVLVLTATLYPLAGWLMTFSPWVPLWGGFVTLWIGVASSFFLPETGTLRAKADEREQQQQQQQHSEDADAHPATEAATISKASGGLITRAWRVLKRDAVQIWRFIITSRQIMLLCLLNSIHNPFSVSMVVYGLQYMTARFEWDWSTATYVLTISRITSVIFLLFLLPAVSAYMLQGFGMNPYKRDLYLFRFSTILLTAGCFMMALAVQPWMMMTSQIVYGMSSGYAPQARALVTALVEPHMLATLNTTLSTLEGIMALIAAPGIGWLLGKGLEWGGLMVGLPYMVLAAIAFVAMVTACLLRVPREMMGRAGNYA